MKNRKLLLVVSLVLALAVSIGSTIAYLTDTDSDVNVLVLGNVDIEQIELQRKEGVDYRNGGEIASGDELEPFKQGKPLFPAYTDDPSTYSAKIPADEQFHWGPYVTADVTGNGASNGLFDDGLKGAMDKFVFVKNTGNSGAYYRTWIALECPETLRFDGNTVAEADLWINSNSNSRFEWTDEFYTTIDGVRYLMMCATYLQELPAGEISRPSLLQVCLTSSADNEDLAALGDTYEILTFTEAVQTANMPLDAKAALIAAFGEPTVENNPWLDADITPVHYVTNADDLLAALPYGGTIVTPADTNMLAIEGDTVTVDGQGSTVAIQGNAENPNGQYGYLAFVPTKGNAAAVSNLTVTGAGYVEVGHHGLGGGTYTIKNLTVKDLNATLAVNNGSDRIAAAFSQYGTATMENCVITGTTTIQPGATAYDVGFVNGTKTTINGGRIGNMYLWHQAKVTINNAQVDFIKSCAITTNKWGNLTIGAGSRVGTIELNPGTYSPALVIQEGAMVDRIIYNGEIYTQAQWLAR